MRYLFTAPHTKDKSLCGHKLNLNKLPAFLLLSLCVLGYLGCFSLSCSQGKNPFQTQKNQCLKCHSPLEDALAGHDAVVKDCQPCHGGQPTAKDKEQAHQGLFGPSNPAAPRTWDKTCGRCHPYQLARVKSTLMYTNLGMISKIQDTWEGRTQDKFAVQHMMLPDQTGRQSSLAAVKKLHNLAGELYRKFCSRCHIGRAEYKRPFANHGPGCAACHFSYNNQASYQGNDPRLKGKAGHSANHILQGLPDNKTCLACHNRSGRIALTYQGLNEGNQAPIPFDQGKPARPLTSGGRKLKKINPDVHFQAGLECIDCHTSREIMGDGYAYSTLGEQLEIRCTNCHGTGLGLPPYQVITRENEPPSWESRQYAFQIKIGAKMVLTDKKRPFSNVFLQDGQVFLLGKRSEKLYKPPLIKGSKVHTIKGHEHLSCIACHSLAVPQCFGCHTQYNRSRAGYDFIKKRFTPGRFQETEDYRRVYPFALAWDEQGRIVPVTPGCQTMITIIDQKRATLTTDYVTRYKGHHQFRFAPFFSHNVQRQGPTCKECHALPEFLGLGEGRWSKGHYLPNLLCLRNPDHPLDGFIVVGNSTLEPFSAIIGSNARPFKLNELKRIFAVNLCLACHYQANDPIYQKKLTYEKLSLCLARANSDPYHLLDQSSPGPGSTGSKR